MRSISALLLAVVTALAIGSFNDAHARDANAASIVRYTLAPALSNGHLVGLDVTLRFRSEASGLTILDLPDEWAGRRELWRNVSLLDVRGAISVVNIDASTKLIRARPRESLTVRYRITSGIDHEPDIEDRQPFRPWIRPNWFYVTGESVFATPHGRDKSPASFDWTDAPPGFGFASSAEIIAGARQSTHLAMKVSDVVDSVSIGGWDLRFLEAPGSVTLARISNEATRIKMTR